MSNCAFAKICSNKLPRNVRIKILRRETKTQRQKKFFWENEIENTLKNSQTIFRIKTRTNEIGVENQFEEPLAVC